MKKSIYWVDFSNNNPHFVNLAGLWMAEMGYQLKGYVTLRDGFTGHPEFNKSVVRIPFKPIAGLGMGPCSYNATRCPRFRSDSAVQRPMIPPPITITRKAASV